MANLVLQPACIICGEFADMDSPEDLCEGHWDDWIECAEEWRCKVNWFSSRTCELGMRGCSTKHDVEFRPDEP